MKNHQSHAAFEADFKAFLDGELTFWRRVQVRRVIRNCPQCREEIRIMQTIETELQNEENVPLEGVLRAKILEQAPLETPKIAPRPPLRAGPQLVFGAASAAVMLALFSYPAYQGFREYRRGVEIAQRGAAPSKRIASGAKQQIQADETAPSAAAGASAAPRKAPNSQSMRSVTNWDFKNGLRNYKNTDERAVINGQLTSPLSGAGSGIYLDNSLDLRQVHKEGSLTVITDNAEAGGLAVENIVKNAGGFVASNSLSTGAGELRSASLDCRVPVEKFEFVTQKIGALGRVRAKSLNGEDITARVAAAAARKTALTREFSVASAQLRQKEKTAKKRDAQSLYYARLEVRQLRIQAAQSRAALQTLQRFSALSALYVTVQDKPKPNAAAGSTTGLGGTARAAWSSFLASAQLPLQMLIWIAAYAPLWLPALILWRKFGRKWVSADA